MGKRPLLQKKTKPAEQITNFFDTRKLARPSSAVERRVQPANTAIPPRPSVIAVPASSTIVPRPAQPQPAPCAWPGSEMAEGSSRGQNRQAAKPQAQLRPGNSGAASNTGASQSHVTSKVPGARRFPHFSRFQPNGSGAGAAARSQQTVTGSQTTVAQLNSARAGPLSQPPAHTDAGLIAKREREGIDLRQMKQSNKLPKTGIVARCNLNLEIEDERVSYEILAPPRSKPLATDQAGEEDEEEAGAARERLMNVVRKAPARAPADAPAAVPAEEPATEVDGRSQDSFFAELLQLPPPLPGGRYGTPTHRPAKDKKQPASILKATSGLKNASSVFAPKSSPSTSTTPKEASVEAFKQRARVSFNPAVSYVSAPSPSYSSASHSSAAGQRKRRSRVLMMGGVQKVGSSSKKQGRSKRKSLMDLLEQVEMQLHEPGEESPLEKASPGKENLTAFERASQEIEMASQELRPLPADPAAAEARDSGAAARSEEAEQAAAHEEAADGVPAMTEKSVTVEERHPTIVGVDGWLSSQGGVFDTLDCRKPSQALEDLEAQLAQQLEEAALQHRQLQSAHQPVASRATHPPPQLAEQSLPGGHQGQLQASEAWPGTARLQRHSAEPQEAGKQTVGADARREPTPVSLDATNALAGASRASAAAEATRTADEGSRKTQQSRLAGLRGYLSNPQRHRRGSADDRPGGGSDFAEVAIAGAAGRPRSAVMNVAPASLPGSQQQPFIRHGVSAVETQLANQLGPGAISKPEGRAFADLSNAQRQRPASQGPPACGSQQKTRSRSQPPTAQETVPQLRSAPSVAVQGCVPGGQAHKQGSRSVPEAGRAAGASGRVLQGLQVRQQVGRLVQQAGRLVQQAALDAALPLGSAAALPRAIKACQTPRNRTREAAQTSGRADDAGGVLLHRPPRHAAPHLQGQPVQQHARVEHGIRYIVLEITETQQEKLLRMVSTASGAEVTARLCDAWMDTPVQEGDAVNLIADLKLEDGRWQATCSFGEGLLITNPDLLLSGTLISNSFKCPRASVIQERFGGSGGYHAVKGTLLHEMFQAALVAEDLAVESLRSAAGRIIQRNSGKLLDAGMTETKAMEALNEGIPTIVTWLQRFRCSKIRPEAPRIKTRRRNGDEVEEGFCIEAVTDIEESIWAPKYGIKGIIDASIDIAFEGPMDVEQREPHSYPGGRVPNRAQQQRPSAPDGRRGPGSVVKRMRVPLELKTGKGHQSHRAQVVLYLLLMEERYGVQMERGLLQYLSDKLPEVVSRVPMEVSALLMQRNLLAAHVSALYQLPPVIQEPRTCARCFEQTACALIHKAVEGGNADSAGMGPAFDQQTSHLTPSHAAILSHCLRLIALEEEGLTSRRAEIWNMSGSEREKLGKCMANLAYVPGSERQTEAASGGLDWVYTFSTATAACREAPPLAGTTQLLDTDLGDVGIAEKELVVVSVEGKHPCVARGVIADITRDSVTLTTQRRMQAGLLDGGEQLWRLDKDEVASNFTRMRKNVLGLMVQKSEEAAKLRRLLIDLQAPRIAPTVACDLPAPETLASLNAEQQQAVQRVVTAEDYALILGLPGTGKTSTITRAAMALLAAGKSVLVSSYTNSAVDNILLKLASLGAPLLRLGRLEGIHPAMRPYALGGTHYPDTSASSLQRIARDARLVGCTALGMDHAVLKERVWDMCIVDEAGQITLPTCLGPLLRARAFTLVGDHYQLPPLVRNKAAAAEGLATSLFRRLCEAHPQAVVALRTQYRMAGHIQLLANTLIYNGALRCGSKSVEEAVLQLEVPQPFRATCPNWLQQVLCPERRVVFLDTDAHDAAETKVGDAFSNAAEADVLGQIVSALAACGVPLADICLVAPYRPQVALLQRQAAAHKWHDVEVLTVDKCQGRDTPALLLSLVRSNPEGSTGRLLADWRRVNVALTRAQKKLVLVGSAQTLTSVPLFEELLTLVKTQGWLIKLPAC